MTVILLRNRSSIQRSHDMNYPNSRTTVHLYLFCVTENVRTRTHLRAKAVLRNAKQKEKVLSSEKDALV